MGNFNKYLVWIKRLILIHFNKKKNPEYSCLNDGQAGVFYCRFLKSFWLRISREAFYPIKYANPLFTGSHKLCTFFSLNNFSIKSRAFL